MNVVYDCETYPNCFTLCAEAVDFPLTWCFEISDYRNEGADLIEWVRWLQAENATMIGFNNVGFDYPILHVLMKMGKGDASVLYQKAQDLIKAQDSDRFINVIYPSDRIVAQIDLYKIHHFDNKARATSLKALEFNMRMDNISDLPFPVGTRLTPPQIKMLKEYNAHDVRATKLFYEKSLDKIRFRQELTSKHGRDFTNHNDTKIGAEIFQMELEKAGVECYAYGKDGRTPKQTKREYIALKECIPQWVEFRHPEFQRIKSWFNEQIITETKGVFTDIIAKVGGLDFIYGTGGLHASVESETFIATSEMMIYDMDVSSLYPSIAIEHGHYPQHLGPRFVEVYRDLRTQRLGYAKNTAENAMLKLALNGTYGKSNDQFSIFYDPKFTMTITLSGQMVISLLAEWLLTVEGVRIIQVNTDGITVYMPRSAKARVDEICKAWEQGTRLQLEYVEYQKMVVRDVNNYLAHKMNGEVKRKGAYEYDIEWHQDGSMLVVPAVAEQVLIHGAPLRETLIQWSNKLDFMGRIRVPRNSRLELHIDGAVVPLENTQRYYVSTSGGQMVKVMPPLAKKPDVWRQFKQEAGWKVWPCNDIREATAPIDYDYYHQEIEKLVLGVM